MKKVYITRKIQQKGIDMLKDHFEVDINLEDRALTKEELIDKATKYDGILTQLNDNIDKEVLDNSKKVKIFANYAVGFNNIDINRAKEKGIIVTNTPDVLSDTTAELAWALLFSVARRITEAEKYVVEGKWNKYSPTLLIGQDINNKTLGIIGAGRIGQAFAKKSIGFDMKVLYHNRRSRDSKFEKEYNAKWVDLDTLLKESDFVSVHVPLTEETRYMLGKDQFKKMKNTAILINTSRGPVINEKELIEALDKKEIWGAGLDVYENEPQVPEELLNMKNVVTLPHIGSASTETRDKMSEIAARNIIEVLNGKSPITPVK